MTDTITLAPVDPAVLDAANWRPVTPAQAIDTLGCMAYTADEPALLAARVETMRDGRVRILYYALGKAQHEGGSYDPSTATVEPYLMHLHHMETAKSVWLLRQDFDLAVA